MSKKKGRQLKYGIKKEEKVARSLKARGAKVEKSPGSKGAADIKATFPSGTKWNVQVKASRTSKVHSPSAKDLGRLKVSASRSGATAVVAKVTPKGINYESAKTGKSMKPPKKKK